MQEAFARDVGGSNDAIAVDREKRAAMQKLNADMAAAQAEQQEKSMAKDKGSVAMRHCLESGRSDTECLVAVACRKVYKDANGNIAYTPHNASCAVGTLSPSH